MKTPLYIPIYILIYILILLLIPVSLVTQGCGEDSQAKRIARGTEKKTEVFGLYRGDTVVLTRFYEEAGFGGQDTVTIFRVLNSRLVIVERCNGERIHLTEKWFNPIGYERKECGE